MATNLLSSIFSSKSPQHLKKFWEVGVRNKSGTAKAKVEPQAEDAFEKARKKTYRSRSAFKLISFDEKYGLLRPGHKVLDIGAAPGSWSEFLAYRTNANHSDLHKPVGVVISIDKSSFQHIDGVISLPGMDFLKESSQSKIMEYLGKEQRFDFIFSDMTSKSGLEDFDKERLMKLVYSVILFSVKSLKTGGGVLIKVWDDGDKGFFKKDMKKIFQSVHFDGYKHKELNFSDTYFIGANFKGLKK